MDHPRFLSYFRLKVMMVRILVNVIVLALVILFLPTIYLVNWSFGTLLLLAVGLGILNAIVKPIMQFLTMPFIFASYGLVVLLVNTLVLYLLDFYFPTRFQIGGLFGALLGGFLIGVLSSFLENLFGLARPILPDEQTELRRRVIAEDRGWLEGLMARSRVEKLNKLAAISASPSQPSLEPDAKVVEEMVERTNEVDTAPLQPAEDDGVEQVQASPAGGEL